LTTFRQNESIGTPIRFASLPFDQTFGELSSLSLILPQAMIFIPLARFPGFGWLILCGAYLPKYRQGTSA